MDEVRDRMRANLLERELNEKGYFLETSSEEEGINNLGGYMIIDGSLNACVGGSRFDFTLDDVEDYVNWLNEQEEE